MTTWEENVEAERLKAERACTPLSPLANNFKPKFREEFICLRCGETYTAYRDYCSALRPNGKVCGGEICPRIIMIHRTIH